MFLGSKSSKRTGVSAGSSRQRGWEWRAASWAVRHPGVVGFPVVVGAGVYEVGAAGMGVVATSAAAGMAGWYRGHPDSFDRVAAPRLRAACRRWLSRYAGSRWVDVALSCDLAPTHRRTGAVRVPRVLRVRCYSRSVDVVWVRMVPGQSLSEWEGKADELAEALRAIRVGVERVRPQILALVVERREPFTEVIDAPVMPGEVAGVDLGAVYLGEDENGRDWCEPLIGQHWLIAGATGAGKASVIWSGMRSVAPLLRDGLARAWMVDPKRIELARGHAIAHRYASEPEECLEVIRAFAEDCRATERLLSSQGRAKFTPTPDTPLNILIIDELAAVLDFGAHAREIRRLLQEIATQGRATGHTIIGAVQEPSKDVVPIRDLFTVRICLRVTSSSHPDMVLGDNARLRGAIADQIPNLPSTAGIGFVLRPRTGYGIGAPAPTRIRAAYVDDSDITELVTTVTRTTPAPTHSNDPAVN